MKPGNRKVNKKKIDPGKVLDGFFMEPDVACDNCSRTLTEPVCLPCKHVFCKLCSELLNVAGDASVKCSKCLRVFASKNVAKDRSLLATYTGVLDKSTNLGKSPGSKKSKRDSHGHNLKRPLECDATDNGSTKRHRGRPKKKTEATVTSAARLAQSATPLPETKGERWVAQLPAQSPYSKVGTWLQKSSDPEQSPRQFRQPRKGENEKLPKLQPAAQGSGVKDHTGQPQELPLSDSGIQSVDLPGISALTDLKSQAKAGPSGVQNISAVSGDQSPGWSRVRKASREIRRNEQTIKSLDISGGEATKNTGVAKNTTKIGRQKAKGFAVRTAQDEVTAVCEKDVQEIANFVSEIPENFLTSNTLDFGSTLESSKPSGLAKDTKKVGRKKPKAGAEGLAPVKVTAVLSKTLQEIASADKLSGNKKILEALNESGVESCSGFAKNITKVVYKKTKAGSGEIAHEKCTTIPGKPTHEISSAGCEISENDKTLKTNNITKRIRGANPQDGAENEAHEKGVADSSKTAPGIATAEDDLSEDEQTLEALNASSMKPSKTVGLDKKTKEIEHEYPKTYAVNAAQVKHTKNSGKPAQETATTEGVKSRNKASNLKQTRSLRARKGKSRLEEPLPKSEDLETSKNEVNYQNATTTEPLMVISGQNSKLKETVKFVKDLIANTDSKKAVEMVSRAINKWEFFSESDSTEDGGLRSDMLLAMELQTTVKANPSSHRISDPISEGDREFPGFPSFDQNEIISETTEQASLNLPLSDKVTSTNNSKDVLVQEIDQEAPLTVTRSLAKNKIANHSNISDFKKLPNDTKRKTFSLDADTQDLVSIRVNEDSFDKRIHEIAKANKRTKIPTETIGNVLMNVTNSPNKLVSKVPSQAKMDISPGPKLSRDSSRNPSDDDLIEQFRSFLSNKSGPNDNRGKDFSLTEFRDLRPFFVAYKGPFVSSTGESIPGKRVFMELDPSSISTQFRIRQNSNPGNVEKLFLDEKTPSAGNKDIAEMSNTSDNENVLSMIVNYSTPSDRQLKKVTGLVNYSPSDLSQTPIAVAEKEVDKSPGANKETTKEKVTLVPSSNLTQPVDTQDPDNSMYDTALESFGVISHTLGSDIKRLKYTVPVSASLRAVIGAGDEASTNFVDIPSNTHIGTQGEGDTVQRKIRKKKLTGKTTVVSKTRSNRTALRSRKAGAESNSNQNTQKNEEMEESENDFIPDTIPDTIPNQAFCGKVTLRPMPPTTSIPPHVSRPLAPPVRVIRTNTNNKSKVNKVKTALLKPCDKRSPSSHKRKRDRSYTKADFPKLTDPQASGTQHDDMHVDDKPETSSKQRFRRIKAPSNSSESEGATPNMDIFSNDCDLPNRMSDEEPDSLEFLLEAHCRNIPSPETETVELVPTVTTKSQDSVLKMATTQVRAIRSLKTPDSFANVQRMIASSDEAAAGCAICPGDRDGMLVDNDITHLEESPVQHHQVESSEDDDENSEDICRPTPEAATRSKIVRRPSAQKPRLQLTYATANQSSKPETAGADAAHIISTSLSLEDTKLLIQLIKMVGAEKETTFTAETTHLVAATNEDGAAQRTVKFIMALASGAWVLSPSWVHKCIESGSLVTESSYEAQDFVFGDSPRRSRLGGGRVFREFAFFLMPPYTGQIKESEFKLILQLAGAAVVDTPSDKGNKKYLVTLTTQEDSSEQAVMNERFMAKHNSLVVAYSWVHTCICAYLLRSVWTHLPDDAEISQKIRSGYPPQIFAPPTDSDDESEG